MLENFLPWQRKTDEHGFLKLGFVLQFPFLYRRCNLMFNSSCAFHGGKVMHFFCFYSNLGTKKFSSRSLKGNRNSEMMAQVHLRVLGYLPRKKTANALKTVWHIRLSFLILQALKKTTLSLLTSSLSAFTLHCSFPTFIVALNGAPEAGFEVSWVSVVVNIF